MWSNASCTGVSWNGGGTWDYESTICFIVTDGCAVAEILNSPSKRTMQM